MDMQVEVPARDIVVIGGSQGALEVLRTLLGALPRDFPAAIMIVLHSGPSSPGYLADIIGRYTALPVEYAREGENIESGRIYVAPADRHLEIAAPGLLHLSDGPKVRYSRPAADRLFTTAAEVFGPRVICVVLSGGDCDGVQGANAVAAAGGKCLVQEPQDAVVASMPISVIQRDHPDAIVSKDNMAVALASAVMGVLV
ncbi:chemotaxis protein CheB [Pseudomonas sp. RC10]|uniref:chemotaxis protein CheB n=1 Tax=Pseudomonas bambusae TaxID=3139142 RepID=UPI0031391D6A